MSKVIDTVAWPNRPLTTFGCIPRLQGQRGVGVAEIMEADAREAGVANVLLQPVPREAVRVDRLAVLAAAAC